MENLPLDVLLSDRFIEFSKKVEDIHNKKKALKAEVKKLYDDFQVKLAALDAQAKTLMEEFDKARKEAATNVGDG